MNIFKKYFYALGNSQRRRSDFTIQNYRSEREVMTGKECPVNVPEPLDLPGSTPTCSRQLKKKENPKTKISNF